jgi:hypothetical protein
VLEHLSCPDHVEARVSQLPRPPISYKPHVELGMARSRAAQRLLGNVNPHDARTRPLQLGRETSLSTANIQHAVTRHNAIQQKTPAYNKIRRLEPFRQSLPQAFVELARGHHRAVWLSYLLNSAQSD